MPRKRLELVIFGKPGSGKDTIGTRVAQSLGIKHISTGDMFRQQVASETDLGQRIKKILDAGHLVDDATVNEMVRVTLQDEFRYILNGYPRTREQALHLIHVIGLPNALIHLQVSDDVVIQRMLSRGREGETKDTIQERLNVYQKQTKPVLEVFKDSNSVNVFDVPGEGNIGEVTERVLNLI